MAKATTTGFDAVLRFLRPTGGRIEGGVGGVRVRIVSCDEADAIHRAGPGWASTALEDGRVLAVALTDGGAFHEAFCEALAPSPGTAGMEDHEPPAWCDDARELRNLLLAFLESLPKANWLELAVGGNGTGKFTVDYGEARLTMAIGRDPNG